MHRIVPVPIGDNYSYLVICGKSCLVIDPGSAYPVQHALEEAGAEPVAVLVTHGHGDHTAGVSALLNRYPALKVYAPEGCFPYQYSVLRDGLRIPVCGLEVEVLHTPGHTCDSFCFLLEKELFTGDTLFAAGCGRIFSGDGSGLFRSLKRLASLPPDTRLWFGHEYARDNLEFALAMEPDDPEYLLRRENLQNAGWCSVPGLLGIELRQNPFFRAVLGGCPKGLKKRTGSTEEPEAVFLSLRKRKDRF